MEIIVLSGGLGNQMFEYAFYVSKQAAVNKKLYLSDYSIRREATHNGLELERLFGISLGERNRYYEFLVRVVRKLLLFKDRGMIKYAARTFLSLLRLLGVKIVQEQQSGMFDKAYLEEQSGLTLTFGFWQSEKYFYNVKDLILRQYQVNLEISKLTADLSVQIQKTDSVSIHIRRGDYLSDKYKHLYGNICTIDYYKQAIAMLGKKVPEATFFVFSDDMKWVKEHLDIPSPVYVDWNKGIDSWQDMYLMSCCKHNIIANSTFSWWGAWLNPNKKKVVIAPSLFLNTETTPDLIPDSWIKI